GQATGDRDGLVDADVGADLPPVQRRESGRSTVDDVVSRGREVTRVDVRRTVGRDGEVVRGGHGEVVVEADRLVDGHQGVEAVGPWGPPAEEEGDLCRGAQGPRA